MTTTYGNDNLFVFYEPNKAIKLGADFELPNQCVFLYIYYMMDYFIRMDAVSMELVDSLKAESHLCC